MLPALRKILCAWCFKPLRQKRRGCHGRKTCNNGCRNKLHRFHLEQKRKPSLQRVVAVKLKGKTYFFHVE